MKPKHVLIPIILCIVGIIAVYFSTGEYMDKMLTIAFFVIMILFFLSMLSTKWIKYVLRIR
jgi:hypothetical protein